MISRAARWGGASLLIASVLLLTAVDAALLQASATLFTAGFNSVYLRGFQILGFALLSVLCDAFLLAGLWALVAPLLRGRRLSGLQQVAAVAALALAVPLSIDFVFYQVGQVLGRMASIGVLWEVAAGGLGLMAGEAAQHAFPLVVALLAGAGLVVIAVASLGRIERATGFGRALELPATRRLWLLCLVSGVVAVAAIVTADRLDPSLAGSVVPKPSVRVLERLADFVTDVDRDGFGLLSRPRDPAPFDGSRNAYALDRRANGIDENGLAGDLPAGARAPTNVPLGALGPAERRPDFLLVYLESFRADRLGGRRNGREITPFLDALAREGSHSERAYVHSPYTIWSRAQLFGGRIDPYDAQDTLIDDFESLGYTVAWFSGQDDSFGDSRALLGLDRVDHFYDAREDVDLRSSRGTSAGGLQVSWKRLLERVTDYLEHYDRERPLFLYVNLVDTHFPYTHSEMDDLLGVPPFSRDQIRVDNAEAVRAAYDNAAANVDLAISRVVERFRDAIRGRDHAILVTSDHGQALFERDVLGHGQLLTEEQTRAPFVLWGVGGDWPEPLGMADVRGLLRRYLFEPWQGERPRARFVTDPQRRIFHYMAQIRHPHLVGLRTADALTSYDLDRDRLRLYVGVQDEPREAGADVRERAFDELIWSWEALRERLDAEAKQRNGEKPRKRPGPA